MNRRLAVRYGLGAIGLLLLAGAGWLASLPPRAGAAAATAVPAAEMAAIIAAMKPPKRQRPVVAILGANDGTEATDYLMPYGILKRAHVAEVVALGLRDEPVTLYPALAVQPQATIEKFDMQYPDGADYVIVPAMRRDDDPAVLGWIRAQAAKGAIIVGVCAGAKVVANAGLLGGKRATTHWYFLNDMLKRHPSIRYVPDRRYVVDRGVVTSTGISASMPLSLALIEAIAGREKAQEVADGLGMQTWDARHDSDAFRFTRPFALTAISNRAAFWNYERLGMMLTPGVDEVALALVADAWSRTYRSRVVTVGRETGMVMSRNGIGIYADRQAEGWTGEQLPLVSGTQPVEALEQALHGISRRYGKGTAHFVAIQLEYGGQAEKAGAR